MNCRRFQRNLDEYLDNALPVRRKAAMSRHARICTGCAQRLEKTVQSSQSIKQLLEQAAAPVLPDPSMAMRLRVALSTPESANRSKPSWCGLFWPAWAAVAVLLLVIGLWVNRHNRGSIPASHNEPAQEVQIDLKSVPQADPQDDLLLSDPNRDWHERRLQISILDDKQQIVETLITSKASAAISVKNIRGKL